MNPKRDLFDEIAELVPAHLRDNYWRLVARLRQLDSNDDILCIVWGQFLASYVFSATCDRLISTLRSTQVAIGHLQQCTTEAGMLLVELTKAVKQAKAVQQPSEKFNERDRRDLQRWMTIIFCMVLTILVGVTALVVMYIKVHATSLNH